MATNALIKQTPKSLTTTNPSIEPGIYFDMPEALYHSLPYLSSSFLKKYSDSPAEALLKFESTPDMQIGSALHSYVLEGKDAFHKAYTVMFESDLSKNSTAYKTKVDEFYQTVQGKNVLPATTKKLKTMDVIEGVHSSLMAHPAAKELLSQSYEAELTLIWDDPLTGLRCKVRIDRYLKEVAVLLDLKKCADVVKFINQICTLHYDIQVSWYIRGCFACGLPVNKFAFIGVEDAAPFKVRTGCLSERWIADANEATERILLLVKESKEKNFFPAYQIPKSVTQLSQLNGKVLMEEWDRPSFHRL